MSRRALVYFDFVSPYSYLALTRLAAFGARYDVAWEPAPVFYAALLDANDLVGPAETRVKRRYTLTDVLRAAELAGVPLVGPPPTPSAHSRRCESRPCSRPTSARSTSRSRSRPRAGARGAT